jgi:sugar lactone lactonase YvrE
LKRRPEKLYLGGKVLSSCGVVQLDTNRKLVSMPNATTRALVTAAVIAAAPAAPSAAAARPFLDRFSATATIASAVPVSGSSAGDQNPYGVAVVPRSTGRLVRGDVLVSDFNNTQNQQGTGSSIVEISPTGKTRVFSVVRHPTSAGAVGLTTALVALRSGYVIVGSLPAPGGTSSHAGAGALTVLNSQGRAVETLRGGDINGPWDMTAVDRGNSAILFVTNVLNQTVAANGKTVDHGTVIRIALRFRPGHLPAVVSNRAIAGGFAERTDPNALVVGPTGLGLGPHDVLYVADSSGNRVAAIPGALTRTRVLGHGGDTVSTGGSLNDPLGLTIAPGGDVVTVNGSDGNIVELTPRGRQVATMTLVRSGAGDLFGLALAPRGRGLYFVDDAGTGPGANSLQILQR